MYFNEPLLNNNCIVCGIPADYTVWSPNPMPCYCLKDLKEAYPSGTAYVLVKNDISKWLINGELRERP